MLIEMNFGKSGDGNKTSSKNDSSLQAILPTYTKGRMRNDYITPEQRLIFTKERKTNLIYWLILVLVAALVYLSTYVIVMIK